MIKIVDLCFELALQVRLILPKTSRICGKICRTLWKQLFLVIVREQRIETIRAPVRKKSFVEETLDAWRGFFGRP